MKYINKRTFSISPHMKMKQRKTELRERINILNFKVIESVIITFINSDEYWEANET